VKEAWKLTDDQHVHPDQRLEPRTLTAMLATTITIGKNQLMSEMTRNSPGTHAIERSTTLLSGCNTEAKMAN
jgi:hypothetical protein